MVAGSASVQRLSNEIVKKLRALLYSVCAACLNPKTGSQQHMIYKMWDISLSFHGFNSGTTKSSLGSRPISNASLFKALFGVWSNFNRFVLSTVLNTIHSNLRCRGSGFILKRQFFSWTKKKMNLEISERMNLDSEQCDQTRSASQTPISYRHMEQTLHIWWPYP